MVSSTDNALGKDNPRLRAFGGHCLVRLHDGTFVGEGDALLARDWTDDESTDLGFVNEPWWGSVELVEGPSKEMVERLHRESQVRLGDWTRRSVSGPMRFPELRLAIVIPGRSYRHLLLSEAGPWVEQPDDRSGT